jgi:hypothetical protein
MTTTNRIAPPRLGPRARFRLAAEILAAYRLVRRSTGSGPLTDTVEQLRSAPPRSGLPIADGRREGVRLGRAVTRTLRLVPARTACLTRSLVLLRILAARGVTGQLVISVLPHHEAKLDAHAWVEVDGRPVLPIATDQLRLAVL